LYQTYFSWSSLLEAIGDGNFLEKYEPVLNLDAFCIPGNIIDQENHDEILVRQFNSAHNCAYNHFLNHPELSQENLLRKIDAQLKFSTNPAAKALIEDTLIRYRGLVINEFDWARESFAQHLTWDSLCGFPFFYSERCTKEDRELLRPSVRKISEWLLRIFHDRRAQGFDLSSFRLVDKIQKELLTDRNFIEKIEKEQRKKNLRIYIPGLLENPFKDLCDTDYIHFSTFGMRDPVSLEPRAGIVFTADIKEVVYTRLVLQLSVMRFLCSAETSKLQLFPGMIFIVDPNSGAIIDEIDVSTMDENANFQIVIDELGPGE